MVLQPLKDPQSCSSILMPRTGAFKWGIVCLSTVITFEDISSYVKKCWIYIAKMDISLSEPSVDPYSNLSLWLAHSGIMNHQAIKIWENLNLSTNKWMANSETCALCFRRDVFFLFIYCQVQIEQGLWFWQNFTLPMAI